LSEALDRTEGEGKKEDWLKELLPERSQLHTRSQSKSLASKVTKALAHEGRFPEQNHRNQDKGPKRHQSTWLIAGAQSDKTHDGDHQVAQDQAGEKHKQRRE
jgi:hypothetical protein